MKKSISAILLALTLVLTFGMSAFANTTYTATELSFTASELESNYKSLPTEHYYYILPSIPDTVYGYTIKESGAPSEVIAPISIGTVCTDQAREQELWSAPAVNTSYYFSITWQANGNNVDFSKLTLADCIGLIPGYYVEAVEKGAVNGYSATFKLKVIYKITKLPESNYSAYVSSGTAAPTSTTAGETVTVTASELAGYCFKNWEVVSGTVSFADANKAETTFTMPSSDVRVKAVYDKSIATITTGSGESAVTKYYATLANAISAVQNGETIQLLDDVKEDITISSGKNFTLDLNGKVVKGSGSNPVITNSGILTVKDSDNTAVHYFNYSKTGAWDLNTTTDGNGAIEIGDITSATPNGAIIKVLGGCITNGYNNSTAGAGIRGAAAGSVLNLTGGNIVGNRAYYKAGGIFSFGSCVLTGGSIIGNKSGDGSGYITGGIQCASLTLGGDVRITNNTVGSSGAVDNIHLNEGQKISVQDGFTGSAGITTQTTPSVGSLVTISGVNSTDYSGNFTPDNANYIVVKGTDNDLSLAVPVASITKDSKTIKYASLADALAAAKSGQTVTLLVNNDNENNIKIPAGVTVDLTSNNYTISATGLTNKGTIVVYDFATATALSDIPGTLKAGKTLEDASQTISFPKGTVMNLAAKSVGTNTVPTITVTVPVGDDPLFWENGVGSYKQMNVYATGSVVIYAGDLASGYSTDLTTKLNVTGEVALGSNVNIGAYAEMSVDGTVTPYGWKIKLNDATSKFTNDGTLEANEDVVAGDELKARGFSVVCKDGVYTLSSAVCKIGDTTYGTVQAAVAAAQTQDTITLLNDVTLESDLAISKEITLDLNDHVINGDGKYNIYNSNKFQIVDNSEKTGIHYWVPDSDGLWVLQKTQPAGTLGKDYFTTTGGCITALTGYEEAGYGLCGGIFNTNRLTMKDVDLVGNAGDMGSAVYNFDTGIVVIENSEIMGNTAACVAGALANRGITGIQNSKIAYNKSDEVGGIWSKGTLVLDGVEITDNITEDTDGDISDNDYPSAGVYSYKGTVTLGNKVIIKDNKSSGENANMVIAGEVLLDVSRLTAGAEIGISKLTSDDVVTNGKITVDGKATEAMKAYFTADNLAAKVVFNDEVSAAEYLELTGFPVTEITNKTVALNLDIDGITEDQAKAIAAAEITSPANGAVVYYAESDSEYLAVTFNGTDWVTGTAKTLWAMKTQTSLADTYIIGEIEVAEEVLVETAADIENGTVTVSPEYPVAGDTVTVTATPDRGYVLGKITVTDKDGNAITVTDGVFTMPEAAKQPVSVTATFVVPNTFVDVAEEAYYSEAVLWAVINEVTNGVDDTHFAPDSIATRAQFLTMLWRAAGCPEPTLTDCPFTDVDPEAYYYKAVLWAIENGITNGVDDTHFAPNAQITRAQAVTFMWREAGSKVVNQAISFKDVPADSWYTEAVRWAVASGITNGTTADTFSPNALATRAHAVTFLFRGAAE